MVGGAGKRCGALVGGAGKVCGPEAPLSSHLAAKETAARSSVDLWAVRLLQAAIKAATLMRRPRLKTGAAIGVGVSGASEGGLWLLIPALKTPVPLLAMRGRSGRAQSSRPLWGCF